MTSATPPDEFDLRALIRLVADDTDLIDPKAVSKEVLSRVPADDVWAALDQALPALVHSVISRHRWSVDPMNPPADHTASDTHDPRVGRGPVSRKVARIRAAYGRELRQVISVGPDVWKRFSDCTVSDLEYAIGLNLAHAAANTAAAAMKQRAVEQLREHAVTTPAELPVEALARVFTTQDGTPA